MDFTIRKDGTEYTAADLGIVVRRGTKRPILPRLNERQSDIPGHHGAYDYGADLRVRDFTLRLAFIESTRAGMRTRARALAGLLLDVRTGGPAQLEIEFDDSPGLWHSVRYGGAIDLAEVTPSGVGEFDLPLVALDPFAKAEQDETSGTLTTSPATLEVTVDGNAPTPARYIVKNVGVNTIHGFTLRRVKEV
jgi:phage-related protein